MLVLSYWPLCPDYVVVYLEKGNPLGDWPCDFSKGENKDMILSPAPKAPRAGQICMKTLQDTKGLDSVLQTYSVGARRESGRSKKVRKTQEKEKSTLGS